MTRGQPTNRPTPLADAQAQLDALTAETAELAKVTTRIDKLMPRTMEQKLEALVVRLCDAYGDILEIEGKRRTKPYVSNTEHGAKILVMHLVEPKAGYDDFMRGLKKYEIPHTSCEADRDGPGIMDIEIDLLKPGALGKLIKLAAEAISNESHRDVQLVYNELLLDLFGPEKSQAKDRGARR